MLGWAVEVTFSLPYFITYVIIFWAMKLMAVQSSHVSRMVFCFKWGCISGIIVMISELSSLSSKVSLTSFRWTLPSPLTLSICDSNSWLYILLISYHKLIFQMVQNLYWATYLSLLGRFSMQWAMLVRSEHQFLLPL